MIALRGTIKRVPKPENEAKTTPSKNINDPGSSEWVWTGYWAFDSLPAPEFLENRKSKRPPHGVRPFVYKFHHVEDAKDVIVPSTTLGDDQDQEEGNREEEKTEEMETDTESNKMKNELNGHYENNILDKEDAMQTLAALDQDSTNVDVKMKNDKSETTSENVVSDVGKAKDSPQEADALRNHADKIDGTKFRSGDNVEKAKESQQNKTEENEKESILGSSFADIDDGIYTDGGTIYPEKCPKGGCWKGYFENVSKRKDRMTSRVQETFHLFFNATPPKGASVTFYDALEDGSTEENDDESKEESVAAPQDASKDIPKTVVDNKKSEIPEGYLHVRGAGTNIFGTFEILGGFNVETSVLEIQRIYVITNDTIQEETKQPRERSKSKPKVPSPASERKSYFTRKRPTVLFRYGESPEPTRSSSAKKRPRGASEHGPLSPLEGIDNDKIKSTTVTASGMKENQPLTITIADHAPAKTSSSRRPSPDKTTPKASAKSKGTSTQAPVLVTQSSFGAIPKAGKPEDAKWRSAHFLYYHRHADDPETSNNPSQPPRTSYVIYEGDMNEGGCIRDGKGVCLYSNDCIYEGDWRKNKEHGKGTLFSGDRKRKIYEGEWERGKMHGKGKYFYYSFSTIDSSNKLQGEYNGDFKENIRHGIGTYTLEDRSSYEGEWRDNVPSGKGIFRWPDGSKYDGHWKDGRRNGFGKLEASDGFVYDGTWVDNAMEGKGFARYPNGQEYDGMWLNGKRDGRGTVTFGNGAVYKGRFKDDCIEGQGTLKIENNVSISFKNKNQMEAKTHEKGIDNGEISTDVESKETHEPPPTEEEEDWMIPIEFQSDIGRIHEKAGFTTGGE